MNTPRVSFEFFPPKTEAMAQTLWQSVRRLEPYGPDFVSVTYGAGGSTRERTHDTVRRIVGETRLKPAAHLTCVAASREEVNAVVHDYARAGVRHIVCLRGDPPEGMGARFEPHPEGYRNATELVAGVRALAPEAGKVFEISVAAYPERHPESPSLAHEFDVLKAKQDAGADRAITQFFFEADDYFRFRDGAAAAGVSLPIVPGIMLQPNFAGLKRIAGLCQARLPDWLHGLYEGTEDDPETRELITANVAAQLCHRLQAGGVQDFHFYTLNRAGLALSTCRLLGVKPQTVGAL
jgi:methylenetetrahydrofolate reductase (NADPH)